MDTPMHTRTDYPYPLIEEENIWVPLPDGCLLYTSDAADE